MPTPTLSDWLQQQPFTLTLSSGFFGFFAHAGLVQALEEQQLFPQKVTGSSAGALIAGCWAGGMSAQDIRELLFSLRRNDFWDPGLGLGLLKGYKFRRLLASALTHRSFEHCRFQLALSAYSINHKQTVVLEQGDLIEAIYASCAIPLMFQPTTINGHRLLDGGIQDRPALAAVEASERVFYHHIASKSPWRRRGSPALQVPQRCNLTSLVIEGLPRSGPFKLERGREAYEQAYQATRQALTLPIEKGTIRIANSNSG